MTDLDEELDELSSEQKNEVGFTRQPEGPLRLPVGILQTEKEGGRWLNIVEVKEMTGVEEDLLATRSFMESGTIIEKLLTSLITKFGTVTNKVDIAKLVRRLDWNDVNFLLIRTRQLSLGDYYRYTVECPKCATQSTKGVDLFGLPAVIAEEPVPATFVKELPNGDEVEIRRLNLSLVPKIKLMVDEAEDKLQSAVMAMRVVRIGDSKVNSWRDVQTLTSKVRKSIREAYEETDYGIDVKVEHKCKSCRHTWEGALPLVSEEFWLPSDTKK